MFNNMALIPALVIYTSADIIIVCVCVCVCVFAYIHTYAIRMISLSVWRTLLLNFVAFKKAVGVVEGKQPNHQKTKRLQLSLTGTSTAMKKYISIL